MRGEIRAEWAVVKGRLQGVQKKVRKVGERGLHPLVNPAKSPSRCTKAARVAEIYPLFRNFGRKMLAIS
jgi:hypothetical protein